MGRPKPAGVVLMGRDVVAVDASAARVMGLRPDGRALSVGGGTLPRQSRHRAHSDARRGAGAFRHALRRIAGVRVAARMSRAHFLDPALKALGASGLHRTLGGRRRNEDDRRQIVVAPAGSAGRGDAGPGHALVIAPTRRCTFSGCDSPSTSSASVVTAWSRRFAARRQRSDRVLDGRSLSSSGCWGTDQAGWEVGTVSRWRSIPGVLRQLSG